LKDGIIVFKQSDNKDSNFELNPSVVDSDTCISSEALFQNESIESVFGLKFDVSASNSANNKCLLSEKKFNPTELLAADSITSA